MGDARPRREMAGRLHADATTSASCYNSTGHTVKVSFRLAAPSAGDEISGTNNSRYYNVLVSAHRDSVLMELCVSREPEYFVYTARPPRLLLLPPFDDETGVGTNNTGILRHGGGDEFVVASLVLDGRTEASMGVLRSGDCKWEHRRGIPVRHADGQDEELSCWRTSSVVAVGNRFLYWIDLACGVIFSDVTAEIPELQYVPLPADPLLPGTADGYLRGGHGCPDFVGTRNVCVTVDSTMRFVRVSPRCCCGGPGTTTCAHSRQAFTVTTWTLRTDDMTWKKDGVLDSGELWAAEAAEAMSVPFVQPAFPIVSIQDPDVVCFLCSEWIYRWRGLRDDTGDKKTWLVAVDMRRNTLRSVCRYPEEDDNRLLDICRQAFLPSEVSIYFNTCHGGGNVVTADRKDEEEKEVLALIRKIPGMARDEMLRAHSLLAGDDRRVNFLAVLPVDMRKEYCMIMMELERNLSLANDTIACV